jgi:DNA primase large subunit
MRATAVDTRGAIDKLLQSEGLNRPPPRKHPQDIQTNHDNHDTVNIDEASHYILRISYCQTEELRKWFLQQECELLRHRLISLFNHYENMEKDRLSTPSSRNPKASATLTKSLKHFFHLQPITKDEKEDLSAALRCLVANPSTFESTQFYAVPFTDAFDLIGRRACYVYQGNAYLTQSNLVSIIVQKFRTHLSHCLSYMSHHTKYIHSTSIQSSQTNDVTSTSTESERLGPLLRNLNRCLTNPEPDMDALNDGSLTTAGLTANTVLQYRDNMPLCMRQLQFGLHHDHKLKHWGRLQYGLFLKGAGLSLDDALLFFQRHFTAVTNEKFQKEYAYGIRHMYGKEGKRASYTPYNCSKIILGNAPATTGDHHGCPYKHYDVDHLDSLLRDIKISNAADRSAIIKLKKSHQYQLACVEQFKIQHPNFSTIGSSTQQVALENVGNHPNSWFRASILFKELQSGKTPISSVLSSQSNQNNTTTISP